MLELLVPFGEPILLATGIVIAACVIAWWAGTLGR